MKLSQIKLNSSSSILKQRPWLIGMLLLTLIATIFTAINNDNSELKDTNIVKPLIIKASDSSKKAARKSTLDQSPQVHETAQASTSQANTTQEIKLDSRHFASITKNAFMVQTWEPPLPKVKKQIVQPPPPPVAPPIPFTYVGKVEEENKIEYFVLQQNKLINLKVGEVVQGKWRLDNEDAKYLNWTYLPMNLTQTLLKQKNQMNFEVLSDVNARP